MTVQPALPRLRATTRETEIGSDILRHADAAEPTVWLRRGDGLIGVGEAARWSFSAAEPWQRGARTRWLDWLSAVEIDDPVGLPGTGPIAFGSFPFDRRSGVAGVLIVPRWVIGRSGDRSWVTEITTDAPRVPTAAERNIPPEQPLGPHWTATLGPGSLTQEAHLATVRRALRVIDDGGAQKIVIARDILGSIPADSDIRRLVRALSDSYPDTWTFAVAGMIGASPETLVTVSGGTATARVLAGTAGRGVDASDDDAARASLAGSAKDLAEHEFAVASVLTALAPFSRSSTAPPRPFTLELPNLWHLASDIEAELREDTSVLDLIAALHPTAAVAGTPTAVALDVIRELEPFDRGRYAGPVGWVDAAGNGEWAIALRCAQLGSDALAAPSEAVPESARPIPFRAYAGGGIVAGSEPEDELRETRIKLRPVIEALTS